MTLLPPETFAGYAKQVEEAKQQFGDLQGWEPLLGGWERLGALAIQVALTLMVLYAFSRGRRWWWYAVGAHTLVDFTTVAFLRLGAKPWGQRPAMLATEGLVAVYALLALWFIRTTKNQESEPADEYRVAVGSAPANLARPPQPP